MILDSRIGDLLQRYLLPILTFLAVVIPLGVGAASGGSSESSAGNSPSSAAPAAPATLTNIQTVRGMERSAAAPAATADAVATATNDWRDAHGRGTLTRSPELDRNAQAWAEHMASTGNFQHSHLTTYQSATGERLVMSENIFYSPTPVDADAIIQAWEASTTGHAENQLFAQHKEVGVGIATDGKGGMWVVQEFGAPLSAADDLRAAIGA